MRRENPDGGTPSVLQRPTDGVQLRRADNNERFVAFAFAAADLVAEVDPEGQITYAAGAFRARLGQTPEAFLGRPVRSLITPADHEALDAALLLLSEKGRLTPLLIGPVTAKLCVLAIWGDVFRFCPVRSPAWPSDREGVQNGHVRQILALSAA